MDSFATPVPATTAGAKWRNVRNVPGTLRHLLNPDSPAYRPDLKSQWDSMSKTQRDLVIQWQAAHTMEAKQQKVQSVPLFSIGSIVWTAEHGKRECG